HAYSIAPLRSRLFPYPTLFRSGLVRRSGLRPARLTNPDKSGQTICYRTGQIYLLPTRKYRLYRAPEVGSGNGGGHSEIRRTRSRSEEHTSELQSRENLVCRLLL